MSTSKSIAKSAVRVAVMMVGFKLLGFIKQAVMAYYYGATEETDIYFVAYGFVSGLALAILRAMSVSSLSTYARIKQEGGKERTDGLISNLVTLLLIFSAVVVLAFNLGSTAIARLLAPAYDTWQSELLAHYVAILSPIFVFMVFEVVLGAVLNGEKKFGVIRTESLFYSLAVIAACVFFSRFGAGALVAARYFATILFTVFVFWRVRPFFSYRPAWSMMNADVRNILIQALPLMLGNAVIQLNSIIDRMITSSLQEGAVSALYYCHILEQLVTSVLIVETGNIIFSYFASMTAKAESKQIVTTLNQSMSAMTAILIPISVITAVESREIVSIVYYRGSFSQEAVLLTATALSGYALSFPCVAIRDFFTKSSYAYQDTKGPMCTGIAAMTVNIILSITLSRFLGILGIAIGTSAANLFGAVLAQRNFKKNEPDYNFTPVKRQLIQMVCMGVVLVPVLLLIRHSMNGMPAVLSFLTCSVAGFLLYGAGLILLRNPTAISLLKLLKKNTMSRS